MMHSVRVFALMGAMLAGGSAAMADFVPVDLRCEYLVDPMTVDTTSPRLFWVIEASDRATMQSAYQVRAASTLDSLNGDKPDLWDSGKTACECSIQVPYGGSALTSGQRVYWKVRVWNGQDKESAWSKPAMWQMGLLKPTDWKAQWIGRPSSPPEDQRLPALPITMLRKQFDLAKAPTRATLYATALGVYELSLNGERVGDQVLAPEWTNYHKRVMYQAFDVTKMLKAGQQVLGAYLGDGWYAGRLGISHIVPNDPLRGFYGRHPRLLVQLELDYPDGTHETVISDASWKCTTDGEIRKSCMLDGEEIDARKSDPRWLKPGAELAGWSPVSVAEKVNIKLDAQVNEPLRVTDELKPKEIKELSPGKYVVDFGQLLAGWCRLKVSGPAGTTITLRHAEVLNPDGTIYTENLRMNVLAGEGPHYGARQTDVFVLKGEGEEVFEPRFTYHGFRFVEVAGLPGKLTPDMMIARMFNSSCPMTGSFECSSPLLNQLMSNIVWTQRDNMPGIPTDCPQRDERLGWTGDILSFCQTACLNMDMAAFLVKWLRDLRDDQAKDGRFPDIAPHPFDPDARFSGAPAWADAGTVVPWTVYLNYADRRMIETHYDAAKRWVDYQTTQSPEHRWTGNRNNDYGDWLNGDTLKLEGFPTTGAGVPKDVFATAFYFHSAGLVANMAKLIGKTEDAQKYADLAAAIKKAFNKAYVTPDGKIQGDTAAGYALALDMGLLPDELIKPAVGHMVEAVHRYNDHISTGFHTTVRLMLQLTEHGHNKLAYKLINNRTFPSWGYTIDNGATTIWERWDGYVKGRGFQDPGMNSFCHYSIGAVAEWMYKTILGIQIDPAHPAYKHFNVRPRPGGGLTWAKGHYDSIHGRIGVDWRIAGGKLALKVTVPANTKATVYVPAVSADAVMEGDQKAAQAEQVKFLRFEDGAAVYEVGSGDYQFESPLPVAG